MNFLAHAYLSFHHPGILRGNMLGDFVKGNLRQAFSPAEQHGMDLHRLIDHFTDRHPAFLELKSLFRPAGVLGAGVFADMFFDHCLASHPRYFNEESLNTFSQGVYQELPLQHPATPEKAKIVLAAMKQYNWLVQYRSPEGIENTLKGMCRRYPRLGHADIAIHCLHHHYPEAQILFNQFFPEIEAHCRHFLEQNNYHHA